MKLFSFVPTQQCSEYWNFSYPWACSGIDWHAVVLKKHSIICYVAIALCRLLLTFVQEEAEGSKLYIAFALSDMSGWLVTITQYKTMIKTQQGCL